MSVNAVNINAVKQRLQAGQPVLGIWSVLSSGSCLEILALSGFDFVILDMEHGLYDLSALEAGVRAVECAGKSPLVRVPGGNFSAVQWALDAGAHGTVFPQIAGYESAVAAVGSARFAPEGTRGFNPFTRFTQYNPATPAAQSKRAADFGLTTLIVETQQAVDELDEILRIPALDVLYIGVYDLSVNLGFAGNTQHPELLKLVHHLTQRIRAAGKVVGLMVRNQQEMQAAITAGVLFLVYAVDTWLLGEAARSVVATFHEVSGL